MTCVINVFTFAVLSFQVTFRGYCIYIISKYFGAGAEYLSTYDGVNLGDENIYLLGLFKG